MFKLIDRYKTAPVSLKASIWYLFASFLQRGISVISTPIFTRLLSTAEYGKYNVFNSWLDIFTVFVSLKLYAGVFSAGIVKLEEDKKRFVASFQGLSFTLTAVWIAVYLCFNKQVNELLSFTTPQVLAMFSLIWTTSVFSFWAVEQRTDNRYIQLVAITACVSILKPVVGIILVIISEDKVTARVLGLAGVEFVLYIVLFIKAIYRGKTFYNKKYWLYALRFNIPLIPHYLSTSILSSADRIMIRNMVGESEAGIYSLAYSVSLIMSVFNTALLQTLEPWIYKKIKTRKTSQIGKVLYMALSGNAIANLFLIALAPEIVRFFAPVEYYDAIWVIPPIAMSVYFMFSYGIFAAFEFYYEQKKYIVLSTVSGALLNILLNCIFINIFGYYAAGYTTFFCYLVYAFLHYLVVQKVCKQEIQKKIFNSKVMLAITAGFTIVGFSMLFMYSNIRVRYGFVSIFFICVIIKLIRITDILKVIKS